VVSDLREDLDRALRTVPVGDAPVDRAKRDGRKIRTRRRVALLVGVLGVVAVAAGYPALTGSSAAGGSPPVIASGKPTPSTGHDMKVTSGPPGHTTEAPDGLTDTTGDVAAGSVGDMKWRVTVIPPGPKNPVPADPCYTVAVNLGAGPLQGACFDLPNILPGGFTSNGQPAAFDWSTDGTNVTTVAEAAQNVAFFIVTFHDGQQLKLIPVTVHGHRYFAWVAPLSMTIDSVVAHLGGAYSDSGQTATAVPFDQPGQAPMYGLWQAEGQSAPPRYTQVIAAGTVSGHPWKITAYEGPWGTCFSAGPNVVECVPVGQLTTTAVLGGGTQNPSWPAGFGSAAPGVTSVRVTLSNGKTVTAHPVGVGNQDLFAFPLGQGVHPVRWTAHDASGTQVGHGTVPTRTIEPTKSASS
jgi:hypothetical protein